MHPGCGVVLVAVFGWALGREFHIWKEETLSSHPRPERKLSAKIKARIAKTDKSLQGAVLIEPRGNIYRL